MISLLSSTLFTIETTQFISNSPIPSITTTSEPSSTTSPKRSVRNTSLIAGVISGVVVFIMLVTIGLLLNHRRKRRLLLVMEPPPVSPYPDTTSAMNVPGEKKRRLIGEDHDNHRVLDTSPVQEPEKYQPGGEPSDTILILEEHQTQEPLQQQGRERRVRHHNDSGWRPAPPFSDAGESSVLDVPPQYDAAV
ncbi:hypothetical protein VNI00_015124 [Paramarasmius palmivorus]|uniref:Uncharacterized protein n=1 Tax=Paramarasmius palmivorus TaxID=297713 RepID=A0AAW0BMX3_9AGAR